jgi:hypothetical protein
VPTTPAAPAAAPAAPAGPTPWQEMAAQVRGWLAQGDAQLAVLTAVVALVLLVVVAAL